MATGGGASSEDLLSLPKRPKVEKRQFLSSWKSEFPWVTFDRAIGMRCKYCMDSRKKNVFTQGCDKYKKDALYKHAHTADHKAAIEEKSGRKGMQQALSHSYRDQELAVIAALRTVYFMAKKNLPNDHFSDLKQFLVVQGSTDIGNLSFSCGRGGKRFTYEHSESVRGFQEAIAATVDENLDNELSQAQYYSLLLDESTDVSTDHNLVMYVRYILDGEVQSRFLCLVDLPSGTADGIVETVLNVFTSRGLSLEKLCGIATDGASVMVGCRTGVTTQLKGKNPFILSVHCIAHRLALASGQAADAVPYVKQYQLYINHIYRYFHYSTKHTAQLKEIQSILQSAERKFHQIFHTRWLSFDGAIDAIIVSLDPLFTTLIENSASDPTANGILKFMATFSFLSMTYLLADILPVLARLSKRFQRSQVDFTTVADGVSVTQSTLKALIATPGPKLQRFLNEIPSSPAESQSFYYLGHSICDSQKQRDDFASNKTNLINKVIENLGARFPDGGTISCFSILDPQNLPPSVDLPAYGNSEIESLATYYGNSKCNDMGDELDPVLNGQNLTEEWLSFKHMMAKNFSSTSVQGMAKKVLGSDDMQEQFPEMLKLLLIGLTLPVSSVDCERGFSKQNLIKTRLRAKLKTENVSTLMKISVDTPDMEQFDFHKAFVNWCSVKERYICRS